MDLWNEILKTKKEPQIICLQGNFILKDGRVGKMCSTSENVLQVENKESSRTSCTLQSGLIRDKYDNYTGLGRIVGRDGK